MKRGRKAIADRANAKEEVLCFRLTSSEMKAVVAAASAAGAEKPALWARETLVRVARSIIMRDE